MSHIKTFTFTRVRLMGDPDICYPSPGRALMTPAYERIDSVVGALRHKFHVSVGPVHYPTVDSQSLSLLASRVAKENSLYTPLDYCADSDIFVFIRHFVRLLNAQLVGHAFNTPAILGDLLGKVFFGAVPHDARECHDAVLARDLNFR